MRFLTFFVILLFTMSADLKAEQGDYQVFASFGRVHPMNHIKDLWAGSQILHRTNTVGFGYKFSILDEWAMGYTLMIANFPVEEKYYVNEMNADNDLVYFKSPLNTTTFIMTSQYDKAFNKTRVKAGYGIGYSFSFMEIPDSRKTDGILPRVERKLGNQVILNLLVGLGYHLSDSWIASVDGQYIWGVKDRDIQWYIYNLTLSYRFM